MSGTPEGRLQRRIIDAIKREHPGSWRFNVVGSPYQMAGVPDILVCVHGLLVGIEVKLPRPGESEQHARDRATAQQRVQIERINRAGGMAGVVLSVDEALDLIGRGLRRVPTPS